MQGEVCCEMQAWGARFAVWRVGEVCCGKRGEVCCEMQVCGRIANVVCDFVVMDAVSCKKSNST